MSPPILTSGSTRFISGGGGGSHSTSKMLLKGQKTSKFSEMTCFFFFDWGQREGAQLSIGLGNAPCTLDATTSTHLATTITICTTRYA